MSLRSTTPCAFAREFATRLRVPGILGALELLNLRTRFRFTGFYRVDAPVLRNVSLFDRENPTLCVGGDISMLDDTYCSIVAATGSSLTIADSTHDSRVAAHVARSSVVSYVGVPVRQASGCIYGTLCHFDARPRIAPRGELGILHAAASIISATLCEA